MPGDDDKKIVAMQRHLRNADQSAMLPGGDATDPPADPPPGGEGGGDDGNDPVWGKANQYKYPDDSPVQPLGRKERDYYFLDAIGSLAVMTASKFDGRHIESLFSPRTALLPEYWPHYSAAGLLVGWSLKNAAPSLMNACSRLPQFDPSKKLRGIGAWKDDDGKLVYHAGDRLFIGRRKVETGFRGGYLYPRRARALWPGNENEASGHADFMMNLFRSWNFERGEDDARLVFGHAVTQLVCGALDFRPAMYLTGDEGSGKTTLLKIFEAFSGLLMASDATPAGVYQTVRDNALPVGLDETEPDMALGRQKAMLALMRSSASGGMILRGSGDHKSVEFTARSSFVFGSITPLQMSRADLSRMPMIEIGQASGELPPYTAADLQAAGAAILARLLNNWDAFEERLALWSDALRDAKHNPRGVDAYGTLLAAADFALHDRPPDPLDVAEDCRRYAVTSVDEEGVANGEMCLHHVLGFRAQLDGEARRIQVFELIRRLCQDTPGDDDRGEHRAAQKRYERTLRQIGLLPLVAIHPDAPARDLLPVTKTVPGARAEHWLAIANHHPGLIECFAHTTWQTDQSGAMSGWMPTLKRLRKGPFFARPSGKAWAFSGPSKKAVLVRIDHLLEDAS